jgi:hypothetical protein
MSFLLIDHALQIARLSPDGWLGPKSGTRWLAYLAQKAYTNRGSAKIVAPATDDKPV